MEKTTSMAALTARDVERMQAPEHGRIDIYDPGCKGLVLRVGQKRKTWIVRHRPQGQKGAKPQVIKIGSVGNSAIEMKAIRVLARQKIAEIDAGADLVAEKRRARAAQTIDELAELYLERWAAMQKKASSMLEDRKMLHHDVISAWTGRKASEIRRADVIDLLERIVERGAPIKANRVRSLLSKMFNFAIKRGLLETNPCANTDRPMREAPRDRCLSNDEIKILWGVLDCVPQTIADMYRLALLTAQRPGEIKRLAWSEIDLDGAAWTLPAARAKNHKAHGIPLSAEAMDILGRRRRAAAERQDHPFVFPGRLPLSPLTEIKRWEALIQKTCGFAFQLRDLRRTAATRIAETGAGRFIVARILNHADRSITAVYDRFEYTNEMRAALIRWGARLTEIVTGEASPKVIQLRPTVSEVA
jgi:integrase